MDDIKIKKTENSVEIKYRKLPWWLQGYKGIQNGKRVSAIIWLFVISLSFLFSIQCVSVNRSLLIFCYIGLSAEIILFPIIVIANPITILCYKKYKQEIADYNEAIDDRQQKCLE